MLKYNEDLTTTAPLNYKDESQLPSETATFSRIIELYNFKPKSIEIVQALSKINRFNGHTSKPYSVARHSIACYYAARMVYNITDHRVLMYVLLHDAHEAYIGDIIRPLKRHLSADSNSITSLEYRLNSSIFDMFKIPIAVEKASKPLLNEIDLRMAATEADCLLNVQIVPQVLRYDSSYIKNSCWSEDMKDLSTLLIYEAICLGLINSKVVVDLFKGLGSSNKSLISILNKAQKEKDNPTLNQLTQLIQEYKSSIDNCYKK